MESRKAGDFYKVVFQGDWKPEILGRWVWAFLVVPAMPNTLGMIA